MREAACSGSRLSSAPVLLLLLLVLVLPVQLAQCRHIQVRTTATEKLSQLLSKRAAVLQQITAPGASSAAGTMQAHSGENYSH
jgi:sensor histidine kinase regulating citrate/malate metabolism